MLPYKGPAIAATILLSLVSMMSCQKKEEGALKVYAYDSFVSEWGPGPKLKELWEKGGNGPLEFTAKGDAAAMLSLLISEGNATEADVIVGIDENLALRALASDTLAKTRIMDPSAVPADLAFDETSTLIPFDHGYFAFMADTEKSRNLPESLDDLLKPEYAKKIILLDPRSSTPGLGFLEWTVGAYGEGWKEYWTRLKPNILTIAPGWDQGYGMFVAGEAPLVISYVTSEAYHVIAESTRRFRALGFSGGHPEQVECVAAVKGSKRPVLAAKFVNFMVSIEAQAIIPEGNWMMPVNPATKLPDAFKALPDPGRAKKPSRADLETALAEWPDILK